MFLCSGLFTYTLVIGNDILHKHFRMFVLLVVHDKDQTAVTIYTEGTMNWVPDHQTLRYSVKVSVEWVIFTVLFGAVKDTEENTFCASGSELYNCSNFLKNKMHQVERLFHQKVMPRLFCLFALKGMRTSLQMEWGKDQLEKIYTCLKYLIYLITKTPQNILLKTFQGEKHLLLFF